MPRERDESRRPCCSFGTGVLKKKKRKKNPYTLYISATQNTCLWLSFTTSITSIEFFLVYCSFTSDDKVLIHFTFLPSESSYFTLMFKQQFHNLWKNFISVAISCGSCLKEASPNPFVPLSRQKRNWKSVWDWRDLIPLFLKRLGIVMYLNSSKLWSRQEKGCSSQTIPIMLSGKKKRKTWKRNTD